MCGDGGGEVQSRLLAATAIWEMQENAGSAACKVQLHSRPSLPDSRGEELKFAGCLTRLLSAALNQKFVANPTINVIARAA